MDISPTIFTTRYNPPCITTALLCAASMESTIASVSEHLKTIRPLTSKNSNSLLACDACNFMRISASSCVLKGETQSIAKFLTNFSTISGLQKVQTRYNVYPSNNDCLTK